MHNIFTIPELLDEIFLYCSMHTKTVAARVCWTWFARSVPIIWNRAQLNDILKVLSPFNARVKVERRNALGMISYLNADRDITTTFYDDGFQQPVLVPHSWERFFLYSEHIRCLDCINIEYAALTQTTLQRPCDRNLFSSNLTTLIWCGPGGPKHIECLLPLLTSTLHTLYFSSDNVSDPDKIDLLCRTMVKRTPSLRVLRIVIPPISFRQQVVSRSLGELVRFLPELMVVAFPTHFITPALFIILSRLCRLEQFLLLSVARDLNLPMGASLEPKHPYDEGSGKCPPFHSLKILDISYDQLRMVDVLGPGVQFLELTQLTYSFSGETYYDQLITRAQLIPTICPNLQKICIIGSGLPWQAIQILLKCTYLVELIVSPSCEVDMELEDMVALASNRSSWKTVILFSSKPLSYHVLIHFAQNCPDLHTLGLTLDIDSRVPDLETFTTGVGFSSLTSLDVRNSVMNSASELEVATYLSSICIHPLEIRAWGRYLHSWKAIERMVNNPAKLKLEIQILMEELAVFLGIHDN